MLKKKNLLLTCLAVFTLTIVTLGASYAFFIGLFNDQRNTTDNQSELETANIADTTLISNVSNAAGSFIKSDIYPGHKEVVAIEVAASGVAGSSSSFQFKYFIEENGLKENVKVSLYKSKTPIETGENYFNCEKQSELIDNESRFFESCEEKEVGKLVQENILSNEKEMILGKDTLTIKKDNEEEKAYYYVVVEFMNLNQSQNEDMNKVLKGKITVEAIPYVYIEEPIEYGLATTYITELSQRSKELLVDETTDENIRYVGASPNNYVTFNNELWRIIGVIHNVENGSGVKESRVKLIRNESIGAYSWDTSTNNINSNNGINEWSQADVMKLLNPNFSGISGSLYWNRQSGNCYYGQNNQNTACDFTSTGLTAEAKTLISNAVWYTGSNGTVNYGYITPTKFYEFERSTNGKTCKANDSTSWDRTGCTDTVTRKARWTGIVGLIYPSDYGFATSGGSKGTRAECIAKYVYNWNEEATSDCAQNNWLKGAEDYYTISPFFAKAAYTVFKITKEGRTYQATTGYEGAIKPSVYLNANVKIIDGKGSVKEPYVLSL